MFRVPESGFRAQGPGLRVLGFSLRDLISGIRDPGSGIRDLGSGIRLWGFMLRVSCSGQHERFRSRVSWVSCVLRPGRLAPASWRSAVRAGRLPATAPARSRPRLSMRKVDIRLPGKGDSNSHGARPVHQIISMTKWIRTCRLSLHNFLCPRLRQDGDFRFFVFWSKKAPSDRPSGVTSLPVSVFI